MQIIGSLGKDAIVKEVNGKNVINFSVAHSEKWKDAQGVAKERTTWVEAAYWSDRTAIAPYLLKGTLVYCEGSPEVDSYQSAGGETKATLRMRVGVVQLLSGGKAAAPAANSTAAPVAAGNVAPDVVDGDLPF